MDTAENCTVLHGHVYQHNKEKKLQLDSPKPRNFNFKVPVIFSTHLVHKVIILGLFFGN